ncbi:MAG: class I SAM-dependent methyltransferase [Thermodesulfobacteriota bacterium]
MIQAVSQITKFGRRVLVKGMALTGFPPDRIVAELVANQLGRHPDSDIRRIFEEYTDDQARIHFGEHETLDEEHLRVVLRFFHAWRVHKLRERIGPRLAYNRILDVGDTDGLILKALGKTGTGFNLSPEAVKNIQRNGIEARLGDGHGLPFEDAAFDNVLCFETLEHVENPHQVLLELARVTKPSGRAFVTIPWVPRTFIHPRDFGHPRGAMHIFEFCMEDFQALLSHTPFTVEHREICHILGEPETLNQRLFTFLHRWDHIVAGTFVGFQFFELAKRDEV